MSGVLDEDSTLAEAAAAELARGRIPGRVRLVGEGMDYRVFAAGTLALRFPRHADAAAWLSRERALLEVIAPRLGAAVPRHLERVEPGGGFPFPWAIYPLLEGTSGRLIDDPDSIAGLAEQLGRLLGTLHGIPSEAFADGAAFAPGHDDWSPTSYRSRVREAVLALPADDPETSPAGRLVLQGLEPALAALADGFLDPAVPAPPDPTGPERLVHGDLDPEHVLVDLETGTITGILDWSDARMGDPARDLSALLSWGGPRFLERALASYSLALDPDALARIPFLARCCSVLDVVEAVGEDDATRSFVAGLLAHSFG